MLKEAILPQFKSKDILLESLLTGDDDDDNETCLWVPPDDLDSNKIYNYILIAKKKRCSEEEALSVLMKCKYDCDRALNSFTFTERPKTLCDGNAIEISNQFSKIITGNRRFGRNRRRCFNKILSEFPEYGMGEILDFYMRNKLKIKRKIARYKRQIKKLQSLPTEEEFEKIISSLNHRGQPVEEVIEIEDDDDCIIISEFNGIDDYWTEKDFQLLYRGLLDYGYNYPRLAAILGTKTDVMIENFIKQQQQLI